mmetsp:Transcript_11006/g.45865  ORF Transcript_11006/g.45865 Transcript_11006/m.45865 type:complete len:367 (-) Transcript_11006:2977-4077(-)
MSRRLRQRGHQAGFSDTGGTLEEDRLRELHRPEKPRGAAAGGRGGQLKAHRLWRSRGAAGYGKGGDAEDAVAVDERAVAGCGGEVVAAGIRGSLDRGVCLGRKLVSQELLALLCETPGRLLRQAQAQAKAVEEREIGAVRERLGGRQPAVATARGGPGASGGGSHKLRPSHQIARQQRGPRGAPTRDLSVKLPEPGEVTRVRFQLRLGDSTHANLFHLRHVPGCSHPNLAEAVAKRRGELLLAKVASRVHRREEQEVRVRHELLNLATALLGQREGPSRLENRVKTLQDGILRQRELVHQQDVAVAHSLDEGTVLPRERSRSLLVDDPVGAFFPVHVVSLRAGGTRGPEPAEKVARLRVLVAVENP